MGLFYCLAGVECEVDLSSGNLTARIVANDISDVNYNCSIEYVASSDGCMIPLSIISPSATEPTYLSSMSTTRLEKPLLLIGYGAYGYSIPMYFQPELAVLVDAGWLLAFAHIRYFYSCLVEVTSRHNVFGCWLCRGGGGYGKAWHESGKLMNKMNCIHDFAACGRHLINTGYSLTCHVNVNCCLFYLF